MANPIRTFTAADEVRWSSKVQRTTDGCWTWTGGKNRKGYGLFRLGDDVHLAHRVAYVQARGPIPEGLLIRHRCPGVHSVATRSCVNPAHLMPGTDADNGADKAACGSMKGKVAGEKNGRAKLSEDQVAELRRRVDAQENRTELAAEFGISRGHLYQISKAANWTPTPAVQKRNKSLPYKDSELVLTESDVSRFWSFVNRTGHCWPWTAAQQPDGYGGFRCQGRTRAAHRVSWLIAGNKLEKGRDIAHTCANRLCVRPDHLESKTRAENMQNEHTRRRLSEANKGNQHHRKLTDDQVRWIKVQFRDRPGVTAVQVARELENIVTPECIANIRKEKTSRHIAL